MFVSAPHTARSAHALLRPPETTGERLADVVRVLGLLSLPVTAIGWGATAVTAISMAVASLAIPRLLGVRPALDVGFCVSIMIAAWSIVLELYSRWANWDIVVHAVTNGLIAALGTALLVRVGLLSASAGLRHPRLSLAIVTTTLGLSFAVVWEFIEWAGNRFMDPTIFVGYTDTLGDIAAGGLGSVVAGSAMTYLLAGRRHRAAGR